MHQPELIYHAGVTDAAGSTLPPLAFLQLVADPVRWEILVQLGRSDRRVGELVALVGKAQNLVSYHLGALRSAGLVVARRSAADGRDTYYRLEPRRFGELLGATGAALHPALGPAPLAPLAPRGRRGGRHKARVLFLCTGNSARSQIAAALLERRAGDAVEVRSAGSHPKALHPGAVRVLADRGIDIAGRPTTHLDRFARSRFDRVITLCDKVREVCPDLPGQPVTAHWSMADPAEADGDEAESRDTFDRLADEIQTRVDLLVAELGLVPDDERSTHAAH
jgi:protein-tyrosine-phosphatase/DNA-binding transcriptional ArsR family regulator